MSFGVADYAASTRARTMGIGAPHPDYGILSDKEGDKPRASSTGTIPGTMRCRA